MEKAQKVLAAIPLRNAGTVYDGCFPEPKQFYFADKHPPKKIHNHVVDSCQRTSVFVSLSGWLVTVVLLLNKELGKVKYCTTENHLCF